MTVFPPPRPVTASGSSRGATPSASSDAGVRLAGALDVVDEPAPPGEQGGVLAPRDPRADGGDRRRAGRHGASLAGGSVWTPDRFAEVPDGIDGRRREVSITVQPPPGEGGHGSLIREA